MSNLELTNHNQILVQQVRELAELFGFETRNKYQIMDANREPLAFAAEEGQGVFSFVLRQFFGHWRSFSVHFMGLDGRLVLTAHHPFRFFFERIDVRDENGRFLGAVQKRFSFFSKRFDVLSERGMPLMEVSSPLWKIWSFTFEKRGRAVATINKKWSGLFNEVFTDKDNFVIDYGDQDLPPTERTLILASSIFIDLLYFERKASSQ